MNVLILFEEVPERLTLYLIENPSEDELKQIELANGTYINSDTQNQSTFNVSSAFSLDEYKDDFEDVETGWPCKWNKCKIETPILKPIDRVYNVGVFL